jgi:hypothetical protein
MTSIASLMAGPRAALFLAPLALAAALMSAPAPAAAYDGGDRVSFGSDVTVREGEEVTGDLVVFGGDAKVYGKVDGDAVVMGGDLFIAPNGEVDGSTVAFGGSVDNESDQSGAHHKKGLSAPVAPVAPIPMETDEPIVPAVPDVESHRPATAWIGFLVVLGVVTLLAFAMAPGAVRHVRDQFLQRPLVGTVIGFSWPFIFAVVMIALAITVIGIVLMPAVAVAVAVAYLIGRAAVAQLLGRRLFEVANVVEPAPLATVAMGLIIITVIEAFLPLWMGIVLEACVSCVAIGAALVPFLGTRRWSTTVAAAPGGVYVPPPTPVFTPPSPPPPPGPPAVPQ